MVLAWIFCESGLFKLFKQCIFSVALVKFQPIVFFVSVVLSEVLWWEEF